MFTGIIEEVGKVAKIEQRGENRRISIQAQNTPDAQLYVIIYPGTDRASTSKNSFDKLSKRALDYMVKTRGFDPRRISIVRGSNHASTGVEIWIVPPGAQPPVVQ